MKVEEIAIRQEVRQLLNEAGINKNTLKDMIKQILQEEIAKAAKQSSHEMDVEGLIKNTVRNESGTIVRNLLRDEIRSHVNDLFHHMTISVDVTDKEGTSSITK